MSPLASPSADRTKPSSNHPLPAAYVAHLRTLIHQSLAAASIPPYPWEHEILEGIRSVPLRRWVDLLGKGMRDREADEVAGRVGAGAAAAPGVQEHEPADSSAPQGSPGRPNFLGSSSSRHVSSASTASHLHTASSSSSLSPPSANLGTTPAAGPSHAVNAGGDLGTGPSLPSVPAQPTPAELAAFLPRIANFQRYPPPIEFDPPDETDDRLFTSARAARPRPAADRTRSSPTAGGSDQVPGAFPQAPDSPVRPSQPWTKSGSLGSLSLPEEEEEERVQVELADQEREACAGKRAVLGLSVWWKFVEEGVEARVRFVEGEWALPSATHQAASGLVDGPDDRTKGKDGGGRMDGLPGKSLADKFLPPPTSPKSPRSALPPAESHGDFLYGLSALDLSLDPESYHLFGGTLVVTLPSALPTAADATSPAPPMQAAMRKILRIALYTHASSILEVALLEAHGRPPLPPPERPSLFRGFSEKTGRSHSQDGRSNNDQTGTDSERGHAGRPAVSRAPAGEGEGKWRKRKAKMSKTWGGLLGALTGGGPSMLDRDWGGTSSPTGSDGARGRERLFSTNSTVVVEGPSSSITRFPAPAGSAFLTPSPPMSSSNMWSRPNGAITPDAKDKPPMDKFSRSVAAIQNCKFSTSPGVVFPPPPLLVRLRDAETRAALAPAASTSSYLTRQDAHAVAHAFGASAAAASGAIKEPSDDGKRLGERAPEGFRLTAEARAGIGCLMIGNGGLEAFGRHQSISVLYQVLPASHPSVTKTSLARTPAQTPPRSPGLAPHKLDPLSAASASSSLSTSPDLATLPSALHTSAAPPSSGLPAGTAPATAAPPTWLTLPYFSHAPGAGLSAGSLGQVIRTLSAEADRGVVKDHVGARREGGDWVRAWMHAGVRIEAVSRRDAHHGSSDDEELEGVLVSKEGEAEGDELVRCWVEDAETGECGEVRTLSEGAESIAFAKYLELLIYSDELFPPSLAPNSVKSFSPAATMSLTPLLRHYKVGAITTTFSVSVFDVYEIRLGKLTVGPAKMPRAGTGAAGGADDDAGGDRESHAVEDVRTEIKAFYAAFKKRLAQLKALHLPESPCQNLDKPLPDSPISSGSMVDKSPTAVSSAYAALHRLSRQVREDEEHVLETLRTTPAAHLNDARRVFAEAVKSAQTEIRSWEESYGAKDERAAAASSMPAAFPIPDYVLNPKTHILPGSAILFNEDEPASFIALTLSNSDYLKELSKVKLTGLTSGATTPRVEEKGFALSSSVTPTPSLLRAAVSSAAPAPASSDKAAQPLLDYTVGVTRVDQPKDFSNAIFSLRGLPTLPKKRSDASLALPSPGILPGRAGNLFKTAPANEPTVTLGSAEGTMSVGDPFDQLVKEISKTVVSDKSTGRAVPDPMSLSDLPHSNPVHRTPESKQRPLSALSALSDLPDTGRSTPSHSTRSSTPRTTEHDDDPVATATNSILGLGLPSSAKPARRTPSSGPPPTSSSLFGGWSSSKDESWTSSISSGIGSLSALVGMGGPGSGSTGRGKKEPTSRASSVHGLLVPDHAPPTVHIEDKPHVVLTSTIGTPKKGLELSCTVYYASAFHMLRSRLGIDKSFVESLAHARPWDAVGGKSKALFFKTHDDRFIIKELVSKWNCSDTQALLEIAPAYFDFILGASAVKPTSFAKILGFYSYKATDLATGHTNKVELIVLENLFFDQAVSRTFDLKGIEGRRVRAAPPEAAQGEVGHDQEWREGQQATLLLVHPHAKRILKEAIANDTRFLSQNNVMDFSMLVGVDEDKKELVLGLVDAIGAYNIFKALESKGKLLANKGGDVTVLPPDQYSARFEAAMDSYFLAAPDKWTTNPSKAAKATARSTIPSVF